MAESLAEIVALTGALKPDYYLPIYETYFAPLRHRPVSLLELGVFNGSSLAAWATYFPAGRIAGIDLKLPEFPPHERIRLFAGDQSDGALLSRAAAEVAPDGFDIIIDDCAHIGLLAKASFWQLFDRHLKPGGFYCIEDWETGYWEGWPDGRRYVPEPDSEQHLPSHDAGMVGFIKQLVDEIAAQPTDQPPRWSKFRGMSVHFGLCVVIKAGGPFA